MILVLHDNSVVLLHEPLHGILLAHSVVDSKGALRNLLLGNSTTRSSDLNIEVHTIDTSAWVVLDTEVNVLLNSEPEATLSSEVLVLKLVFLNLQTFLKDLFGLLSSHGNMTGDLVITANTETSDRIASCGCISSYKYILHTLGKDGLLIGKLLQHLSCTSQSVTRLTDANIENELLNAGLTHWIILLGFLVSGLDLVKVTR